MSAYVLIWILYHGDIPYTGTAEFNDLQSCEKAAKVVRSHLYTGILTPKEMIECVKK